jgi:plasmid stabilization system protein ParE
MKPRVWRFHLTVAAARQAEEIAEWWAAHRPLSPDLFTAELAQCLERLAVIPNVGAPYADPNLGGLRRTLMRATRHHVYYTTNQVEGIITIHAVWHAARGTRPGFH